MASRQNGKRADAHGDRTNKGHTRDVVVTRIGEVTVYRRGKTYYLYYRENGQTKRPRVDGNLAVARAMAARVVTALEEKQRTPYCFQRTSPSELVSGYLDYSENVVAHAWRTLDRYRAALSHFCEFCTEEQIKTIDAIDIGVVENFVRWLRGQTRTRNGHTKGRKRAYAVAGIQFILGTCKTAFNWANRQRMLPPYAENPFSRFKIGELQNGDDDDQRDVFTAKQQRDFFAACTEWQRDVFLPLAMLGLRVGELTHLLVCDVDLDAGILRIRGKPELMWRVKTRRKRDLPLSGDLRELFSRLVHGRQFGFVFMNKDFMEQRKQPAMHFRSDAEFRRHLAKLLEDCRDVAPGIKDRELRKVAVKFCRALGQIPTKRLQTEFMAITSAIGCPEYTRVHDLRHVFATRAQEAGVNPLVVQQMLGHSTLEMTRRYTHLGMDEMRHAVESLGNATSVPMKGQENVEDNR